MIPWETLGRGRAPDGGELILCRRDREYVIRVDGRELMSTRCHSEEEMARLSIARLPRRADLRVLIGGLGMGYTARAALDALPPRARVVVAEIADTVVEWNRGPLAHLAGRPLDDPRLQLEIDDVARVMARAAEPFDAILFDVDNGPRGLTRPDNQLLYNDAGLAAARRALRPGGVLAVWSASGDVAFERRLRKARYEVETLQVPSRLGRGATTHTIFFARAA